MRILIIDHQVLFRQGLAILLADYPDIGVVGNAGTLSEGLAMIPEHNPDVILLDINLPDTSGIDALAAILTANPEVKVILMSVYEDCELMFNAIRLGAKGFLVKGSTLSQLTASLRAVERNEIALTRKMVSQVAEEFARVCSLIYFDEPGIYNLTYREKEILWLLGENRTNAEIAQLLCITINTCKVHVHNILKKLRMNSRREAGLFARSNRNSNLPRSTAKD